LLVIPIPCFAEEDSEDSVELLGWLAIGCGVLANIPFIPINRYRKYSIKSGGESLQMARENRVHFKTIMNLHIMLNSIGYFAGMSHGFILSRHLDGISLSLAVVMTLMVVSGFLLLYTSSKNSKIFNHLLHGQLVLVILLAALVILHVIS